MYFKFKLWFVISRKFYDTVTVSLVFLLKKRVKKNAIGTGIYTSSSHNTYIMEGQSHSSHADTCWYPNIVICSNCRQWNVYLHVYLLKQFFQAVDYDSFKIFFFSALFSLFLRFDVSFFFEFYIFRVNTRPWKSKFLLYLGNTVPNLTSADNQCHVNRDNIIL